IVVLFCVSFCADVFRASTTALNESNATIAAATIVVRVDEWRFIDGSFSLDLILWLATVCELSMGFRNRYSTARRGGYSPPNRLDHKRGRGIPAPTRGTAPNFASRWIHRSTRSRDL